MVVRHSATLHGPHRQTRPGVTPGRKRSLGTPTPTDASHKSKIRKVTKVEGVADSDDEAPFESSASAPPELEAEGSDLPPAPAPAPAAVRQKVVFDGAGDVANQVDVEVPEKVVIPTRPFSSLRRHTAPPAEVSRDAVEGAAGDAGEAAE
eukprot:EG_transcript_39001